MARVLDVVVRLVDLERAGERVLATRVVTAEAARVHLPRIEARLALDDPLGDEAAHSTRTGKAVRTEARGDPEAADIGLAEDELPVGSERLRAVHELHDFGLLETGHPNACVRHQLLEPVPVLGQELAVEVRGDAVETPRGWMAFVTAHHKAPRLTAEVDEERGVAHGRHVERNLARLRDQVLVRHRDHGNGHTGQGADLPCEHAAGVHDHLGLDRPLVRLDATYPATLDVDSGHPRVRRDLGAALPGSFGEGVRELARVDVAVGREVGGAEDSLRGHGWEQPLGLLRRDELERKTERRGPAGLP